MGILVSFYFCRWKKLRLILFHMKTPERWCTSRDPCCKVPSPQSPIHVYRQTHTHTYTHTHTHTHRTDSITSTASLTREVKIFLVCGRIILKLSFYLQGPAQKSSVKEISTASTIRTDFLTVSTACHIARLLLMNARKYAELTGSLMKQLATSDGLHVYMEVP